MNNIYQGLLWNVYLLYIDDLLVFSKTFEKHLVALEAILQRARERNLKFRGMKCELFLEKLEFLGHEVSAEGVHTSKKKVETILQIQIPKTAKEAHSCVCLAGYYRKFIKGFADISRPIHTAVHAENFVWSNECQEAFDKLKQIFATDLILAHPNFEKPFEIECDTSQT
jgi:hypothetical protein